MSRRIFFGIAIAPLAAKILPDKILPPPPDERWQTGILISQVMVRDGGVWTVKESCFSPLSEYDLHVPIKGRNGRNGVWVRFERTDEDGENS